MKKYQRIVMDIIYKDIKAGKIPDIEKYNVVATHLEKQGSSGNYPGMYRAFITGKNNMILKQES